MSQTATPLVVVTTYERDDGVLVRLSGRLDRRSAADVRAVLRAVVSEPGVVVHLDLDEAVVGDSTAIGLLVELRRRAVRLGGDLRVVAADDRSARILRRARLFALLAPSLRVPPMRPSVLAGAG